MERNNRPPDRRPALRPRGPQARLVHPRAREGLPPPIPPPRPAPAAGFNPPAQRLDRSQDRRRLEDAPRRRLPPAQIPLQTARRIEPPRAGQKTRQPPPPAANAGRESRPP